MDDATPLRVQELHRRHIVRVGAYEDGVVVRFLPDKPNHVRGDCHVDALLDGSGHGRGAVRAHSDRLMAGLTLRCIARLAFFADHLDARHAIEEAAGPGLELAVGRARGVAGHVGIQAVHSQPKSRVANSQTDGSHAQSLWDASPVGHEVAPKLLAGAELQVPVVNERADPLDRLGRLDCFSH